MKKYWGIGLGMALVVVPVYFSAQGGESYVRKQIEPDFFIPESAKQQPEKLPVPRYLQGEEETIKEAHRTAPVKTSPVASENEDVPEFQQKYDAYNQDLEHIGRTGKMPYNVELEQDLKVMNSNDEIIVEKKPYQQRNTKAEFDKALEKSLQQN